jgi:hypothetical protein
LALTHETGIMLCKVDMIPIVVVAVVIVLLIVLRLALRKIRVPDMELSMSGHSPQYAHLMWENIKSQINNQSWGALVRFAMFLNNTRISEFFEVLKTQTEARWKAEWQRDFGLDTSNAGKRDVIDPPMVNQFGMSVPGFKFRMNTFLNSIRSDPIVHLLFYGKTDKVYFGIPEAKASALFNIGSSHPQDRLIALKFIMDSMKSISFNIERTDQGEIKIGQLEMRFAEDESYEYRWVNMGGVMFKFYRNYPSIILRVRVKYNPKENNVVFDSDPIVMFEPHRLEQTQVGGSFQGSGNEYRCDAKGCNADTCFHTCQTKLVADCTSTNPARPRRTCSPEWDRQTAEWDKVYRTEYTVMCDRSTDVERLSLSVIPDRSINFHPAFIVPQPQGKWEGSQCRIVQIEEQFPTNRIEQDSRVQGTTAFHVRQWVETFARPSRTSFIDTDMCTLKQDRWFGKSSLRHDNGNWEIRWSGGLFAAPARSTNGSMVFIDPLVH